MTLEQIKSALQDRRLQRIAKATGLHYNTLRNIRDNPDANPTHDVIKKIEQYLTVN